MMKTMKAKITMLALSIVTMVVAFTAFGWLFGSEVIAPHVQCAEEDSYNCVYHDESGSFVVVGTEDLNIRIPW